MSNNAATGAQRTAKPRTSTRRIKAVWCFLVAITLPIAGLIATAFFWLIGARFTINGTPYVVNWFLELFKSPVLMPTTITWQSYVALCWVPLLFSGVEFGNRPRKVETDDDGNQSLRWQRPGVVFIWLLVAALDMWSTYAGLSHPADGSGDVVLWLAASWLFCGLGTVLLTFGPEWLAHTMLSQIGGAWRNVCRDWST